MRPSLLARAETTPPPTPYRRENAVLATMAPVQRTAESAIVLASARETVWSLCWAGAVLLGSLVWSGRDALAAAPRVTVALRVGGVASARVAVGETLAVDIVATTAAEIDGARVTVSADPTYWRFDGGSRVPMFPILPGVSGAGEPGRYRLDVARAVSPWPTGTAVLGTMRFVATANGSTTIGVVSTGAERTRVAGNREELALATSALAVVIGEPVPTVTPYLPPPVAPAPPAPVAWRPSAPAPAPSGSAEAAVPTAPSPIATGTGELASVAPPASAVGWVGRAVVVEGQGPNAIPAGFEPGQRPVASEFSAYYERAAGMRLLGRPMGDARLRGGLVIQYFEKGRLELHPDALEDWRFQLGLLVDELARMRALVPLGGDTSTMTYADVARLSAASLRVSPPDGFGGGVSDMPDGSTFVPFDAALTPAPGHYVPRDFWRFLNDPSVFPGGWLHDAGLPITPVAEAVVTKGGVTRPILVQAFQRTILTLDPLNPADYVVECANAGTDFLRAIGPG